MNEKFCRGCETNKSVEEFSKAKNKHDGVQAYCKPCYKKKYAKSKRKRTRVKINGSTNGYQKESFDRKILLQQISKLREKESNPQTKSGNDYSFLWTNEKFWE